MAALVVLTLAPPARAQSFLATDLEGTWEIFQLATPQGSFNGSSIGAYRGLVTFDATGAVSDTSVLTEGQGGTFFIGGSISITTSGVVTGTLSLTGLDPAPSGELALREARLLDNRHTIIGAATLFGQVGLFTFAKREPAQTFSLTDIGGDATANPDPTLDWSYHELTPANDLALGDAAWVNGSITFHGSNGCTEADLVLPDGTVRTARTGDAFTFN